MSRRPPARRLIIFVGLILSGCSCLRPHPCEKRKDPVGDKQRLRKESFHCRTMSTPLRTWTVYVSRASAPGAPPVVLLHEMPALSADVLDLGRRLAEQGFTVYVPLLFGRPDDNPQNELLGLTRGIALRADPKWRAGRGDVHRPIIDEIATLCRKEILPHHPGQRLGVIGMCLTGVFPIALLRESDLPVAAPVVSQPAIPLPSCTEAAQSETGISPDEMQLILRNVAHDNIEILGFRFELDKVSPEKRFEVLKREFNVKDRHFIDCTVRKSDYVSQGHLSDRAHSVLAGCYHKDVPPHGSNLSSTEIAWRRLLAFLHAKLDGAEAHPYVEPFPERL